MTAWDWDLKTGTVVSSAMTRDIFGVDGVTGDVFLQMVHPEDRSRMQETIRRALVKEHSYSLEFRIVRPDGTLRWVHSRGVAEVDSAGRPLRMIGIASDITGQRRVSARLAAEHAIARTLATACSLEEAAPAIVGALVESFDAELGALWLVDPDADRLRCAAVPSHGASSSLREFADRCGELSCGRGEGLPGRVWATGEWAWSADLQADAHLAQGTTTVNPGLRSALAFPIHVDGHLAGVIEIFCAHNLEPDETMLGSMKAIANDISQFLRRRRAEDEVARLNRDLRHRIDEMQTLFDVAPVGIAVAEDPGCNVIRANPACASILGIANEVNASKSGRDAHRLPFRVMKDGREVPVEALPMQYAAATGVGLHEVELDIVHEDGRVVHLSEYASPLRDEQGNIRGCLGVFVDITERKRAGDALREAARRKDEFLAILGHELRNPLAPIRNCLDVLRLANATPAQRETARTLMERQVLHLSRLVDDLLDVSRISSGRILLRKERLDATEIVRATVGDYRESLEQAGLRVALDLADEPLWIVADATRLCQAVGNVLHNAAKFTGRGGLVSIGVKRENDDTVAIAIRDSGIGMEREMLDRSCEAFSQADRGLDRSGGGLGLGLALVKRLLELHGGSVDAASEGAGRGSLFTLRLPLEPGSAAPAAAPAPSARSAHNRRRVLIVEDDISSAASMSLLLELSGHTVAAAHDGPSSIETARQFRPEVVVCDIGLPGEMDGYAVAKAFRADPSLRSAFLIALTGYGQHDDRRRAEEAGFDTHLTKPADPSVLKSLLGDAVIPSSDA